MAKNPHLMVGLLLISLVCAPLCGALQSSRVVARSTTRRSAGKIANDITELIGNTPMCRVKRVWEPACVRARLCIFDPATHSRNGDGDRADILHAPPLFRCRCCENKRDTRASFGAVHRCRPSFGCRTSRHALPSSPTRAPHEDEAFAVLLSLEALASSQDVAPVGSGLTFLRR